MKGFNLLEFLIVIVVMSVLGWITFRQFELAKAKSRDIERKSSLHEFSKAVRLYYADYGKLPSPLEINKLWGKQWEDKGYVYMKSVPKENYLKKEYCYDINPDGKSFKLFAELENKSDADCKKELQKCGNEYYCFMDTLQAVVIKN